VERKRASLNAVIAMERSVIVRIVNIKLSLA